MVNKASVIATLELSMDKATQNINKIRKSLQQISKEEEASSVKRFQNDTKRRLTFYQDMRNTLKNIGGEVSGRLGLGGLLGGGASLASKSVYALAIGGIASVGKALTDYESTLKILEDGALGFREQISDANYLLNTNYKNLLELGMVGAQKGLTMDKLLDLAEKLDVYMQSQKEAKQAGNDYTDIAGAGLSKDKLNTLLNFLITNRSNEKVISEVLGRGALRDTRSLRANSPEEMQALIRASRERINPLLPALSNGLGRTAGEADDLAGERYMTALQKNLTLMQKYDPEKTPFTIIETERMRVEAELAKVDNIEFKATTDRIINNFYGNLEYAGGAVLNFASKVGQAMGFLSGSATPKQSVLNEPRGNLQ